MTRSCGWSIIVAWTAIAGGLATPLGGQTTAPPPSVKRRLGQMLFPQVLFDSTGKPELGQPFVGDPHGFGMHRAGPSPELPGVEVWQGWTFRCFDCDADRAAVILTGTEEYSIATVANLGPVLQALLPAQNADSAAIRVKVLALLELTCILDCHVWVLGSKADVRTFFGLEPCHAVAPASDWSVEPASQGMNGTANEYRLTLQTGFWITQMRILWSEYGYDLVAERVADCALRA